MKETQWGNSQWQKKGKRNLTCVDVMPGLGNLFRWRKQESIPIQPSSKESLFPRRKRRNSYFFFSTVNLTIALVGIIKSPQPCKKISPCFSPPKWGTMCLQSFPSYISHPTEWQYNGSVACSKHSRVCHPLEEWESSHSTSTNFISFKTNHSPYLTGPIGEHYFRFFDFSFWLEYLSLTSRSILRHFS